MTDIQFPIETSHASTPSENTTPIITVSAEELIELIEAKMVHIKPIHYGSAPRPEGYGDAVLPREGIMGFLQRRAMRVREEYKARSESDGVKV